MKYTKMKSLLAVIPTLLLLMTALSVKAEIYGVWHDYYTDTKIEIKPAYKGIKVKQHGGFLRRWRTYNHMGRGVYDDCDGRVIVVLDYDRIKWKRRDHRRPIELSRYGGYGYRDSGRRNYNGYNTGYGRGANTNYGLNDFCGEWECHDTGVRLSISPHGNGFRAYANNRWSYYEPYKDYYRDRRGNRYYFDDGELCWSSYRDNGRRRFRKR